MMQIVERKKPKILAVVAMTAFLSGCVFAPGFPFPIPFYCANLPESQQTDCVLYSSVVLALGIAAAAITVSNNDDRGGPVAAGLE